MNSWQSRACQQRANVTVCPGRVQWKLAGSHYRTCVQSPSRCSTATHSLSRWRTSECRTGSRSSPARIAQSYRRQRRSTLWQHRRRLSRDLYQFYVDEGHWTTLTSSTTPCHLTTASQILLLALLVPRTGTDNSFLFVVLMCCCPALKLMWSIPIHSA